MWILFKLNWKGSVSHFKIQAFQHLMSGQDGGGERLLLASVPYWPCYTFCQASFPLTTWFWLSLHQKSSNPAPVLQGGVMNQDTPNSFDSPRNYTPQINWFWKCHAFLYCTHTTLISFISKDLGNEDEAHTGAQPTVLI